MAKQTVDNRRRPAPPALDQGQAPSQAMRSRPANENDPGGALMLQRLRRAPSYDVIWGAVALSTLWSLGWIWIYKDVFLGQATTSPSEFLQAIATLIMPVLGMLTIAYFQWRAQQLRQVSEILMHQSMRLLRPQDVAAEGLTTIAQAVRQEIDLLVGGIEHAFQRVTALEDIVQKEVSAVERAFTGNEERIRSLVNGLETQRTALQQTASLVASDAQPMLLRLEANTSDLHQVVGNALSTFGRLEEGLRASTNDLTQTIENVALRTAEAGQEIGGHATQLERASTMLLGDFRNFSGQLQEHVQSLNYTASNLGNETTKFGIEVKGMETNLVELVQQTAERLLGSHTEVSKTIDQIAGQSEANARAQANDLLQTFGQLAENINMQLRTTSNSTAEAIERSGLDTAKRIEQANALVATGLNTISSDYLNRLIAARDEVSAQVEQSSALIVSELDTASLRFNERFIQTGTQLVSSLDNSSNALSNQLNTLSSSMVANIESTTGAMINQLTASGSGLMSVIESSADKYSTSLVAATVQLDKSASGFAASVGSTSSQLGQEVNAIGNTINELLITTSGAIAAHLKDTSETVSRQMQDSGVALAQNIEASGGNVTERLITVSSEYVQKLNATRDSLFETFVSSANDLTQRLDGKTNAIYGQLQSTSDHLSSHITVVAAQIFDRLDGTVESSTKHIGEATAKLNQTAGAINAHLQSTSNSIVDQLDTMAAQVQDKLSGTLGQSNELIAGVTLNLTTKLDSSSTQLGTLLASTEHRLGTQLEQASSELETLFSQNSKMLTQQLEQSSNIVTLAFANTAVLATQSLNGAASEVTKKIDDASQAMFTRLHSTSSDLGNRFDVATDHLNMVTTEITNRLEGQGQRFSDVLDQASGQIFTDLGKARDAFAEGLTETTAQISGRFEAETGHLVGRIDKAVQEFDTTSNLTSTKLEDISDRFAMHVNKTSSSLTNQLASAAGEVDAKLETVSNQIAGKLEMTGSLMSERLEDVAALVDKSINKYNLEMENMLQSRRDMLDTLVSEASNRAAEVDKAMHGHLAEIEERLAAAETRAQTISRLVSDQSTAALAGLEQELRKLEGNSTGQMAQAARALREQHEKALANMNEMLASTASDFQQTAQDMRITAQQVVKEIDAARGELKKAIIDLPDETRSNADAMRRVVADQINALNTLADVVRKQSGSLDFSGPGYLNPPRSNASTALKIEPNYAPAPLVERAVQTQPREGAAPKQPSRIASLAREVETTNAKLNVSARDVVEAIEGQLPRDLERLYAANDKSVYTSRLFEQRSRKLITALQSRYAEERLLRSRIQAFNRLFEKLLDSVSNGEGGGEIMEQVLASEQGQIYVMLADVAGRLPNQG